MSLGTLNNGDSGLEARTKINAAIGAINSSPQVPTGTRISGYWVSAPSGYIIADGGTIGDGSSGGSKRAKSDAHDLFVVLWEMWFQPYGNVDPYLQDSTGAGTPSLGSAEDDWQAHYRISVPDERSRVPVMANGWQIFASVPLSIGASGGEENHTITTDEMPNHLHDGIPAVGVIGSASALAEEATASGITVAQNNDGIAFTATQETYTTGGGAGHNNIQPFIAVNVAIKL